MEGYPRKKEGSCLTLFHAAVMTFLVAMVPVLELRGAIPIGVAGGLSPLAAMGIAIVGNMVPVPILIVFTRQVFQWLKKRPRVCRVIERLEHRAAEKSRVVERYAWWGLCILVAIPLPGTGAWTGALVAAVLGMRLKNALPAILLGVLLAAFIVTCLTFGITHLL